MPERFIFASLMYFGSTQWNLDPYTLTPFPWRLGRFLCCLWHETFTLLIPLTIHVSPLLGISLCNISRFSQK
jgi:hypothetical protein